MSNKIKVTVIFSLSLLIAFAVSAFAGPTADEIVDKAVNREMPKSSKVVSVMKLVNKRGEVKERKLEILSKDFGKGEKKRLIRFLEPDDIRGTGFLVWTEDNKDDIQHLWLPALRKPPRKIASSEKDKSFMGSEMTYGDMQSREVEKDKHEMQGEEKCPEFASVKCWKIKSTPKDGDDSQYSSTVSWIRQDNYIPVRVDYYDLDGDFLKKMLVHKLENVDGFWTPMDTEMANEQNGRKSTLTIEKIENNLKINDNSFTLRMLSKF